MPFDDRARVLLAGLCSRFSCRGAVGHRKREKTNPKIGLFSLIPLVEAARFELFWRITMAARRWTQEQRQRQAENTGRTKPWTRSSGPTSAGGKAKVFRNADNGGKRQELREMIKALHQALREQRSAIGIERRRGGDVSLPIPPRYRFQSFSNKNRIFSESSAREPGKSVTNLAATNSPLKKLIAKPQRKWLSKDETRAAVSHHL